jgi:hypothetical protein
MMGIRVLGPVLLTDQCYHRHSWLAATIASNTHLALSLTTSHHIISRSTPVLPSFAFTNLQHELVVLNLVLASLYRGMSI